MDTKVFVPFMRRHKSATKPLQQGRGSFRQTAEALFNPGSLAMHPASLPCLASWPHACVLHQNQTICNLHMISLLHQAAAGLRAVMNQHLQRGMAGEVQFPQ